MRQLHGYSFFDGHCAEAVRFYAQLLGGEIERWVTLGEAPLAGRFPAPSAHRIFHASLKFDGNLLQSSDWIAAGPYPSDEGLSFRWPAAGRYRCHGKKPFGRMLLAGAWIVLAFRGKSQPDR